MKTYYLKKLPAKNNLDLFVYNILQGLVPSNSVDVCGIDLSAALEFLPQILVLFLYLVDISYWNLDIFSNCFTSKQKLKDNFCAESPQPFSSYFHLLSYYSFLACVLAAIKPCPVFLMPNNLTLLLPSIFSFYHFMPELKSFFLFLTSLYNDQICKLKQNLTLYITPVLSYSS